MHRIAEVITILGAVAATVVIPGEFQPFAVSVVGTMLGAFVLAISASLRTKLPFSWAEFAIAFVLGLFVAPMAMAYTPIADVNSPLWHNFSASGLGTLTAPVWIKIYTKIAEALK